MVQLDGIVNTLTGITDLYGEDPLVNALVPALMVGLLMFGALSRVWE